MPAPCRVLIVDDSRIFRELIETALRGTAEVVGSVFNGEKALEFIAASPPDLVTLDFAMPGLDGLATLKRIQEFNATRPKSSAVGVLMVSAVTKTGARVTIEALEAGAFDFVTKPSAASADENRNELRRQLAAKVRAWQSRRPAEPAPVPPSFKPMCRVGGVRAVLIGVSTGGPAALATLLPPLCEGTDVPVFVVQHMPDGFIPALVASLGRRCSHRVVEARDGEAVAPRTVYFAPSGRHMVLRGSADGTLQTGLNDQPPEQGFRPSVDVLFRSAAAALGGAAVALVLTGMQDDGTRGLGPLKRAGAYAIAQDEASSVVWGMPGAAVAAGLIDAVLRLERIPAAVHTLIAGRG
jgi:two-component system chemotaxis response regulator CheB